MEHAIESLQKGSGLAAIQRAAVAAVEESGSSMLPTTRWLSDISKTNLDNNWKNNMKGAWGLTLEPYTFWAKVRPPDQTTSEPFAVDTILIYELLHQLACSDDANWKRGLADSQAEVPHVSLDWLLMIGTPDALKIA